MRYLKFLPQMVKKEPVQLTFFVTRRCNSRCPYCFYLRSKGERSQGEELSLEEIKEIARGFKNLLWLSFSGGEIFLREDIDEIAKAFYDSSKPAIMLFPTNGLLPDRMEEKMEEVLSYCRGSSIVVKLSIDALGEKQDQIRGVEGNFERLMESYSRLAKLAGRYPNLDIGVNTLYSSLNEEEAEEVIDFVKSLDKVSTHTLSLVRGDLEDEGLKDVDHERYRKLVDKLESERENIYSFPLAKLKTAQDVLQRKLIYQTAREKKRLIPCYAGRLNLVLTENGDVYPCEILSRKMGNLREQDYSMEKLLEGREAREVLSYIAKGECHCTHECYFITNILFNPGLYPRLLREYVRL